MYEEQLVRIDHICKHLTDPDRHVSDDAALNRLITHLLKMSEEHTESFISHLAQSPGVFDSFYIALTEPDDLNINNVAFLNETFGIYYALYNRFDDSKRFETAFFNLFSNETFKSSGTLRNAWLVALPRMYRLPSKPISMEQLARMLTTLSNDSSVFVRRQLHTVTVDILNNASSDEFAFIFTTVVLCNDQYLYSVMLKLKTSNKFELFERLLTTIVNGSGGSIAKCVADGIHTRVLPLYVDFLFHSQNSSNLIDRSFFDACYKTLDHVVNVNMFVQLYLLHEGHIEFDFFKQLLLQSIKSGNIRHTSLILDAFLTHLTHLSTTDEHELIMLLRQEISNFKTSKEQNMVVTLLQKSGTKSSFDLLFLLLKDTEEEKVKFRTISAINHIASSITPEEGQIEAIYDIYFGSDWEVKDSVLDFVFAISKHLKVKTDVMSKFSSIIAKCLIDEMGLVRANAIRVKTELFLCGLYPDIGWTAFLKTLVNLVSADLDFNVRRGGLFCLRRLIFERYNEFQSVVADNVLFTNLNYDDIKPVLNYERCKVDELGDLLTYLSYDDDWEVKSNLIKLIYDIMCKINRIGKYK